MRKLGKELPSVATDNNTGNDVEPGRGQVAIGVGLKARGEKQTVYGRYNQEDPEALVIVGCGTSDSNRKNMLVVDKYGTPKQGNGKVYITSDDKILPVYVLVNNQITEVLLR